MPSSSNKKLLILYILEVLKKHSDESHPLLQKQIVKLVENMSGIVCERKTIASNIDALNDFFFSLNTDLCINKVGRKGWYLSGRAFEKSELQYLIDYLLTSKSIPAKYAKDITEKLLAEESENIVKKFRYICNAGAIARVDNKQIFAIIDKINLAIDNNKKLSFCYLEYNTAKKLVAKKDGKRYVVSPYFMQNNNGRYFLVCNFDGFNDISNYKIDRMSDVEILDEKRLPETEINGYADGINRASYTNENPYMFGGEKIVTTLLLHDTHIANELVENFGDNVSFDKKNSLLFADVKSSPLAIVYWALQYGECVEIVAPETQRNKIVDLINSIYKNYI